MLQILQKLDLLSVGVIVAAIGILGFIVYFNNPKSITNKTFLRFCLLTIAWGTFNFLSYQVHNPQFGLWLLRISIFTAVWHSLMLFKLLYVFPKDKIEMPRVYQNFLLPFVFLTALVNLTGLTFHKVVEISTDGRITKIENGPGIALFSFVIFGLIIVGVSNFIKRIRAQKEITIQQVTPIIFGIVATFSLILIFNFVFPAFLNNSKFVSFGAFFVFPFIAGTGYAIFKHGFLNIKVVSTEILTFILAIIILLEMVTSKDATSLIIRAAIFILVVTVGILLIKSVLREIEQKEQLQKLSEELSDANGKLTALDKARAEFISIASHQLRTPPATIKWFLGAILSGDYGKMDQEVKKALEKAQRTNNSLISLIEDMLNVSRIERGKMEFLFEPVDLLSLAELTFEQLQPIALEKKLELLFNKPAQALPQVMADKEKLRQVMNNLIDNAIKYTKQGSILVELFTENDNIRFQVTDTGKGIGPVEQKLIFEKYSRGKESIIHSAGLGLGLYVAKVIVEQHKGKIWAESKGEGTGSTFVFTVPIHNNLKATTLFDLTQKEGPATQNP